MGVYTMGNLSVCGNVRAYMGVKLMCYQEMCMCVCVCERVCHGGCEGMCQCACIYGCIVIECGV